MDAIQLDKSMSINFNASYEEQSRFVNDFKVISTDEFDNFAGFIDGFFA